MRGSTDADLLRVTPTVIDGHTAGDDGLALDMEVENHVFMICKIHPKHTPYTSHRLLASTAFSYLKSHYSVPSQNVCPAYLCTKHIISKFTGSPCVPSTLYPNLQDFLVCPAH